MHSVLAGAFCRPLVASWAHVRPSLHTGPMTPDLLLAFEQRWPRHSGHKEEQIRRELGITPARYYQLLGRVAKTVEGIAADPFTARRVRERVSPLPR